MRGPGWTGKISDYPLRPRWKSWFPSELERREAARFEGLTWQEFQDLPGTREVADLLEESNSKCDVIAHFRAVKLHEAVLADLQAKHPPPPPPGSKPPKRRRH